MSGCLQVIDWRVLALTGASLNVDGDEAGVWGGGGVCPCHCSVSPLQQQMEPWWNPVKRVVLRYCLNQLGAGGGLQVVFDQHERMLWRMSTVSLTANDHPQSAQIVGVYGKWLRERGLAEQRGEHL